MRSGNIALALAIVFLVSSPSLFAVVPSMKKIPADMEKIIYYNGKLGIFNMTTLALDYQPVRIERHIKVMDKEGNVLVVREDIKVMDSKGNEMKEFGATKIYGIDERTAENIKGYGDLDRIGHWIFPVGIEKKNYLVWNSDLDDACINGYISPERAAAVAHYMGEDRIAGIKTYKFYGSQKDIYVGNLPELPEAKLYYGGEITAWADVVTGTIVDLHKHVEEYADFPNLHKIPSNLNMSVELYGKLKMLNQSNGLYESHNLSVIKHVWVDSIYPSYYIIGNKVIATDENGDEIKELEDMSKDAVNPYTMEYIGIIGNKRGLMTFPVGVGKRNYMLWNPDINNVTEAIFCKSIKIGDTLFYVFFQNVSNYFIGDEDIEGMSDRKVQLYYSGSTKYLVEPESGTIAYIDKKAVINGKFPNLRSMPENLHQKIKMEGNLWIISQTKKNIEMIRDISVKNVYWEDGNKVLLLEDNTTAFNKKDGSKIDEASKTEYHGVYADSMMEAKNYGDMERDGLFTFPIGVEKRDYMMWNTEINDVSPVNFIREEDHEGIHTYLFETNEDRMIYDERIGGMARYITNTKYWVEPNTGIVIDMKKETVEKVNPLQLLIGIQGFFWIDAIKLNLQFSKETIEEAKTKALELSNLVKYSEKNAEVMNVSLKSDLISGIQNAEKQKKMIEKLSDNKVKVVDLYYQMDENSIEEMANECKKATFMLMFLQIIIPALLIIIAIALIVYGIRR